MNDSSPEEKVMVSPVQPPENVAPEVKRKQAVWPFAIAGGLGAGISHIVANTDGAMPGYLYWSLVLLDYALVVPLMGFTAVSMYRKKRWKPAVVMGLLMVFMVLFPLLAR